jgi:hypothetical protein
MGLLYGRTGRLTAENGGFRPGQVHIPSTNTYYVCVRYEAAYLFETEFTLKVSQGGVKLTKIYGQRSHGR